MPARLRKWALRLSVTTVFIGGLLLGIVLLPRLSYAHRTSRGAFTVYH